MITLQLSISCAAPSRAVPLFDACWVAVTRMQTERFEGIKPVFNCSCSGGLAVYITVGGCAVTPGPPPRPPTAQPAVVSLDTRSPKLSSHYSTPALPGTRVLLTAEDVTACPPSLSSESPQHKRYLCALYRGFTVPPEDNVSWREGNTQSRTNKHSGDVVTWCAAKYFKLRAVRYAGSLLQMLGRDGDILSLKDDPADLGD